MMPAHDPAIDLGYRHIVKILSMTANGLTWERGEETAKTDPQPHRFTHRHKFLHILHTAHTFKYTYGLMDTG